MLLKIVGLLLLVSNIHGQFEFGFAGSNVCRRNVETFGNMPNCQPTCKNPEQLPNCTKEVGCYCVEGYVRMSQGDICIEKSECPPNSLLSAGAIKLLLKPLAHPKKLVCKVTKDSLHVLWLPFEAIIKLNIGATEALIYLVHKLAVATAYLLNPIFSYIGSSVRVSEKGAQDFYMKNVMFSIRVYESILDGTIFMLRESVRYNHNVVNVLVKGINNLKLKQ